MDGVVPPATWLSADEESFTSDHGTAIMADGNMLAVAARIQERAQRLLEEQNNLLQSKEQLARAISLKEQELQTSRDEKRKNLEGSIARNQTELKLFHVQDKVKEQKIKNHQLEIVTKSIKEECDKIQARFNNLVESLYAPHEMEMEKYRTILELKRQNAQKQQHSVDGIESKIRKLVQAEKKLIQDKLTLSRECEELQKEEREGVQLISSLAADVKQALSQVRASVFKESESHDVSNCIRLLSHAIILSGLR